jgi:CO/xanthine dehydrogenase FAD-binding subunit
MLPAFDLKTPDTLPEALEILAAVSGAQPIAGGTNLIPDMRAGTHAPATLVDVSRLQELCCIRHKDGHLLIGGGVTIAELLDDPMIGRYTPILTQMGRSFANALIRNRATIGGNLVNAAPCSDTAPALLVLDAEVELTSADGARRLPLDEFLVGAFETKRRPSELLTCVRVLVPSEGTKCAFEKMGLRKVSCMAKVDVAVRVETDDGGVVTNARIAVAAVAPAALRAKDAEDALKGQLLTAEATNASARLVSEATFPRAGSEYKRRVVEGITRRLLTSIADEGVE